ncbi:MAG: hypothetical protein AYK19_01465 [Theionarchaea archaeon DG-70-1]|nr:MAG: hypothetical protein AYK19_01465 [Theionarchaea archaeon DG-70-1]
MKRIYPLSDKREAVYKFQNELPYLLGLNFYGYTTWLQTNSERLYDHIHENYSFFVEKTSAKPQSLFVVLDDKASDISDYFQKLFPLRKFTGSLIIADELDLIFVISTYSNLAYAFACMMFQSMVLHLSKDYFNVHAAALVKGDTGFLFPGSQHCGKTTLTLELIKRGYKLLSDDLAIINRETLEVMPFPRALNIREKTLPLLSGFEKYIVSKREFEIADEKRWFLDLKEFAGSPFVPNIIVFPQLAPAETAALEPFSKTLAVLELIRQSMAPYLPGLPQPDDVSNFEVGARLVQQASTYRLMVGTIEETVDLLLDGGIL